MAKVIVIGAGISGLTVAYLLRACGHDVVVFDQGDVPGGRVRSQRIDGFLMEHGANSVVGPAPVADNLIAGLGLGNEKMLRGAAARHRYLVRGGRLHALPLEVSRLFMSGFFTLRSRLRLLMEPLVSAHRDDETVAAFTRRRLGREMLDYVMDPLAAGLYAGDSRQLSVSAVFPQLKRLECRSGSILLGVIASHLRRDDQPAIHGPGKRVLFSFRQGLGMLPCSLADRLSGRIFLGHRVESVQRGAGSRFRVLVHHGAVARWIMANSVVVALPAYAAANVLDGLDRGAAETLAGIGHPPVAVVFLGYRANAIAHPLDGLGALMPTIERRNVLGILFSSTLFPGRAPPEHVAMTAFVGGARQPQLAMLHPDELIALAHSEVRQLLGGRTAPVVAHSRCWHRGLPQPGIDHARRLGRLAAVECEHAGLFVTGNYIAGVSTAACIEQAVGTAHRVERHLAAQAGGARRAA